MIDYIDALTYIMEFTTNILYKIKLIIKIMQNEKNAGQWMSFIAARVSGITFDAHFIKTSYIEISSLQKR